MRLKEGGQLGILPGPGFRDRGGEIPVRDVRGLRARTVRGG